MYTVEGTNDMSKKQQKQNQENMKQAQELVLVCHAIGLTEVTVQEMYLAIMQAQSAEFKAEMSEFSNEVTPEAMQCLMSAVRASRNPCPSGAISLSE